MEIRGKIIVKLPLQSGTSKAGNPWSKQEYVLETMEAYPKRVHFHFGGERANQYPLEVGDVITLSFDIESREFNGRWYTDLRAWRIAPAGQDTVPQQAPRTAASAQNVPAGFAPRSYAAPTGNEAPAPTIDDLPADLGSEFGEDLPF